MATADHRPDFNFDDLFKDPIESHEAQLEILRREVRSARREIRATRAEVANQSSQLEEQARQAKRGTRRQMLFTVAVAAVPITMIYPVVVGHVRHEPAVHINSDTAVERAYRVYLGRAPDGGNENFFYRQALIDGADDAVIKFLQTEEVRRVTYPMTNQEYVNAIYELVYGAEPDQTGNVHWVDLLNEGASREWVARAILERAL